MKAHFYPAAEYTIQKYVWMANMNCRQFILSENTLELIVDTNAVGEPLLEPDCIVPISEKYEIWYYDSSRVPPLSLENYTYAAIPKCYGLVDSTSLEVSGILKLQNQPTLSLTGQGVFVAVIDTGIQYMDFAFRNRDGSTRIFSIWDQTQDSAQEQGEIFYGTEYTRQQINDALAGENPYDIVPQRDENGHGTFLASVACGSPFPENDFTGAAPDSELLVVKLKPAKKSIKDFFFVPDSAVTYAESDIMAAISYVRRIAAEQNRPLVIYLGFGTNNGNHAGTSPLCDYLDQLASQRHQAIVAAAGNEAANRHHFYGQSNSLLQPQNVEINLEQDGNFYVELWALAPERYALNVQSPTGELQPRSVPVTETSQTYSFLFEGTRLTIDYRDAGRTKRDQLIFLRFEAAKRGIWTIRVYPQSTINGYFHMWLPMQGMLAQNVFFLRPNPDVTITSPADALLPITAGGYNAYTNAVYLESGRGFRADGMVKPDFLAPAVEVQGKDLRGNYTMQTGTSVAAAITAGACAQVLQWAVTDGNAIGINSVDIQNFLIRGATRSREQEYPSVDRGYGKLNVYSAFELLR